ncbi:hypothetical protein CWR45_13700 [Oceanobacillus chungangensis]|uniref:Uncharacterized protein n=1 Tax=Oceanobacillus chungangensis TaxID=1229152 RepID=A0A3D8PN67_9BACI|nr:hypothetical protein CWR45_13700 [Oceanobacillus chungangensis]
MFGLSDFLRLTLSVLIILPAVSLIRELGYIIAGKLLGGKGMTITIGSGPSIIKFLIFDVRKYYFMYCWSHYDSLKLNTRWTNVFV